MSGITRPVASGAHTEAVERLVDSYSHIAPGQTVRLAKPTSNLFRGREGVVSGLDVSGLRGVLSVDPVARTARVQGMCTYEDLVDATLPYGLIPLVVPQLRTITLGGAVTGLGIESTSFRHGLPHESVIEMDVLTGSGEVVTARPDNEHRDLFFAFPNSYGSLGYAVSLLIELEPVKSRVGLRHLHLSTTDDLAQVIAEVVRSRAWEGIGVDGLDGIAFSPGHYALTLATWTDREGPTSDYTGQQIYWSSVDERDTDLLTTYDYLWRWDTDWFWCSRAFGAQHRIVRRLWPRAKRRSDVYHRLVGLDRRFKISDRLDRRAGRPQAERVVQDVEVPLERLGEFLDWFDQAVGLRPVWLCPLRLRDPEATGTRPWSIYPLLAGETYVNVGFWGNVPVGPEAPAGPRNRAIEAMVTSLGGHKSLYSEAFYSPEEFAAHYNGQHLTEIKRRYDPDNRLTSLYDKVVRQL